MNSVIQSLFDRKSVRIFLDKPISEETANAIIDAGIQGPSAGNQQLYGILDIRDQAIKERLAVLCDNQPFIASAPLVLVFLADTRRWLDCYRYAGADAREPGPGDLLLCCADAMIAAQNMVCAAQSLGIGSCYIGDILENREELAGLLHLDPLAPPITMLVFGYPAESQLRRPKPPRPHRKYLIQTDRYSPRTEAELRELYRELFAKNSGSGDFDSFMRAFCGRKYMSGFAIELNRSAGEYLSAFIRGFAAG
ncbi:MAG: nitroreductase family protein [Spirochaetaceae bacterium]|jgi:nitroreductase|nr:nitroreductase family protein [Spirochaetaceae bacterium]